MVLLVFGAGGQLGREIGSLAGQQCLPAVLLSRQQVDIADGRAVAAAIDAVRAQVVINAAAYTKVDQAEDEPRQAFRDNCEGPGVLADTCARRNLPLIHVSTDYVFDGSKPEPYVETDAVAPLGVYGVSKEAGEQAVRQRLQQHVIIRTAWVYGIHGSNFLKTMLRLAHEKASWGVVDDQMGNPTATIDLAEAIVTAAQCAVAGTCRWGTYHFAGAGSATWHDFACEIVRAQARFTGRSPTVTAMSSAGYPTKARRPANSRLDSTRFASEFGFAARPWQERTREVVAALVGGVAPATGHPR
jgi:dTDP-4-dehydrorhamnose reductase